MCGINGIIGLPDARGKVAGMNRCIQHRGPDADGVWADQQVALGHQRLSIIDLSASANQPMVKDHLAIVYNGEVYNFPQLKQSLEKDGVVFKTHSDTEVVLELFRKYRQDSFSRLTGMFAFAVYDTAAKEIFLVRDYCGIKPLYYTVPGGSTLAFSSEIKALVSLPEAGKELNPDALVSSINYLWIYGNQSIFKDIRKVPPASYVHIKIRASLEITTKTYWQVPSCQQSCTEEEAVRRLRELLEQSVRRHLIADVPVGSFLSGGLDSSLICALAKQHNKDLSTFTISLGRKEKRVEQMGDDNYYARKVASLLGVRHTDITVDPQAVEYLRKIVSVLDEPIGDPAAINTYLICQLARSRGIKVLLSGMGADELFGGYRRHYATLLSRQYTRMPVFAQSLFCSAARLLPVRIGSYGIRPARWAKRFCSFLGMSEEQAYLRSYSYYGRPQLSALFKNQFNDSIDKLYRAHREQYYRYSEYDAVNRMCGTDIAFFMEGLNLTYTDRASMAHAVEVRVPYIDKEVIEYAMLLPQAFKIRGRTSKYILKKAARAYLPQEIVYRPKASFGMPLRAWISTSLRELIDDALSESTLRKRGLFDPAMVRKIIADDRSGREDNAYRIYQLLTVELWMQQNT